MGQVGLEFDFERLRARINAALADGALMAGLERCHRIFSVNYGLAQYVDRSAHRASEERAANPIQYAYLKDVAYAAERELRVTLSAMGMGHFVLADGREIGFPRLWSWSLIFAERSPTGRLPRSRPGHRPMNQAWKPSFFGSVSAGHREGDHRHHRLRRAGRTRRV
jgi:hypothetical protein